MLFIHSQFLSVLKNHLEVKNDPVYVKCLHSTFNIQCLYCRVEGSSDSQIRRAGYQDTDSRLIYEPVQSAPMDVMTINQLMSSFFED